MKKLSNEDFLLLILEEFGSISASRDLASNIMRSFSANCIFLEKDLSNLTLIDFSLPFYRKNNDFSSLVEKYNLNVNNYLKWENIFATINDINKKSKYSFVNEIWFEFDAKGFDELSNSIPGFFFDILNFTLKKTDLIIELIFQIRGGTASTILGNKIGSMLALLGSDCEKMGAGIFPGRKDLPIRIVSLTTQVKAIELLKHYQINDKILDFLRDEHSFIGEKVIIHFNITDTDVNFQGIELYSRENRNWEFVYESLVKHSLCDPKLKPQILARSEAFFDNTIISEHIADPNSYSLFFYCCINHFKLVNNEKLNLKVYHKVDFFTKINKSK